jgi:hypothetical protein
MRARFFSPSKLDFVQFCIRDKPLAASDSSQIVGFLPGLGSQANVEKRTISPAMALHGSQDRYSKVYKVELRRR